jgi:RNA polymerase sigma-70 factor (ECF subfamily)
VLATSRAEAETDLVTKARQGDRNAFGELVQCHHRGVINVVYRMCGDMQLAEDAAQESFLRAWMHLDSYRPGTSLRNWLYRIAINAALDALRKSRESSLEEVEFTTADDPGPETELLQKERSRLVQHAVMELTDSNRTVLVLREYGGLSYQEIASNLDIPIGTVMSRLNYARSRLREILEPQMAILESNHG